MKKNIALNFLIIFTLSNVSISQEFDPSILENLTPEQIQAAKNLYNKNNAPLVQIEQMPALNESIKADNSKTEDGNKISGKKYGYSFFSTIPTSVSAVGDLPFPNEYKISLRDQFTIIMSGSKEAIFDLNVKLDGTILFPELGSISVVGETLEDIKSKLRNLVDQSYVGVQVDVSIKNLSAKKITIVGAVKTPGTYLVNPFSTISSALAYSGGISEIGTLRSIRLIRSNGDNYKFDLYKLLIKGDRSDDITIESGDVIVIDPAEQFINLSGEVKRPAIYEIKNGETLNDLIAYGLGFNQIANQSNINLEVLDIISSSIKNINSSDLGYGLANVIAVDVNKYVNKNISNVRVLGAIKEPGYYPIKANETLDNFIDRLDFVDVYPWLAVLEQFDEDNLVKSSILFSLNDKSTYSSIKLFSNSKLYFANIFSKSFDVEPLTKELIKDYELKINHKGKLYSMPVYGDYNVKSFIDLIGLDMVDVDPEATYISPIESIVIRDDYRNMQFTSKKFHTVSFRSPVNDLISVTVSGAVSYPGTYTLQSKSTIQDLYDMIGSIKDEAFLDGIIFTRQSVRDRQLRSINKSKDDLNTAILTRIQEGDDIGNVDILMTLSESINPEYLGRIAGDFAPGSNSASNTILNNGDNLIIPRNPNTINVLGEVLNPISFEYSNGASIQSAINIAGGYKDYADKKKIYVIRSTGIIEKANRNIFVKNIDLNPGDTIVVPRKIITNNPGIEALVPLTKIISDLAFSAAAIESLSKN